jgi:RNA polymerase sigma-70 factor, ECF subfamily
VTAELSAEEQRLVPLMVGYQNGSMDDFASLYAALERPLSRYLWTFVRNQAIAEELLQDTFLQLHRARHTYTPPRPVKPWIYAITRHVALMHLRSRRRRPEFTVEERFPEVPVLPEVGTLADESVLQRLLAMLPRPAQEVLVLHHMLGLSFEEVGRVIGVSAGAAKVRAHRALKAIRQNLAEEEEPS